MSYLCKLCNAAPCSAMRVCENEIVRKLFCWYLTLNCPCPAGCVRRAISEIVRDVDRMSCALLSLCAVCAAFTLHSVLREVKGGNGCTKLG